MITGWLLTGFSAAAIVLTVASAATYNDADRPDLWTFLLCTIWVALFVGWMTWMIVSVLRGGGRSVVVAGLILGLFSLLETSVPGPSFWALLLLIGWIGTGIAWFVWLMITITRGHSDSLTSRILRLSVTPVLLLAVIVLAADEIPFTIRFDLSRPALAELAASGVTGPYNDCVRYYCVNDILRDGDQVQMELGGSAGFVRFASQGFILSPHHRATVAADPLADIEDLGGGWYYFYSEASGPLSDF